MFVMEMCFVACSCWRVFLFNRDPRGSSDTLFVELVFLSGVFFFSLGVAWGEVLRRRVVDEGGMGAF